MLAFLRVWPLLPPVPEDPTVHTLTKSMKAGAENDNARRNLFDAAQRILLKNDPPYSPPTTI